MGAALPISDACCLTACESVVVEQVPGPVGPTGAAGTNGTNGISAVTTLTAAFTMPAELATGVATVADSAGFVIGENVFVQTLGYLEITAIGSATSITLKNLESAGTSVYLINAAPGTIAPIGSRVAPAGIQGPTGATTGAAGGDLKGTYPSPRLAIPNTLGAIIVGNGTDAVSLAANTAGFVPVDDAVAFPATRIGHKKIIPVTGDTNVAADRVAKLSAGTGLPIPLIASKASIKDPGVAGGVIVADATAGNARGIDAVDLQVQRASATQVASGNRSVIAGGEQNLAGGTESFVGAGEGNVCNGSHSAIVGGSLNTTGPGNESFVGGGDGNLASGTQATVAGGDANQATGDTSCVGGGESNHATGTRSTVAGGSGNVASGSFSSCPGGFNGVAAKYGQMARASGSFAAAGDAQTSELIVRRSTTTATPAELFLDNFSLRATVPLGTSWIFQIMVVARNSAGNTSIYKSEGAIQNTGGVTAAFGVTTTEIYDGIGLPAAPVAVTADDPNDALIITVTGIVDTIRWVGKISLVEVTL